MTNSTSSHSSPSTTPTGIITHPLTPTPTPSVPSAYTPDEPTAPPHHMSLGTKLGLGMIPVVVGVCFIWIFFLLWWRRRQARKAILMGKLMPLTPEKGRTSFTPLVEDSKRGSRVLNLSAYSTQVSGGRTEELGIRNFGPVAITTTTNGLGEAKGYSGEFAFFEVRSGHVRAETTANERPGAKECNKLIEET
ncbi:hypothetical protein PTMSG1_01551 [Pyrenophora teres f. maculata]|nr:hypothetical protein PTMSG1_01551 [Pyrenophora teres f. maculata]